MATISYKAQPAIHKTRGAVPLVGTSHLYTVTRLLWPAPIEHVLDTLLIHPSLHVCCGASHLGHIRVDADVLHRPTLVADAAHLPFRDRTLNSVLCDPPYNGRMRWNHDLLTELSRVATRRIIFQHWFIPADMWGRYRKDHRFSLTALYAWQPRSYFGRVQMISVFDAY